MGNVIGFLGLLAGGLALPIAVGAALHNHRRLNEHEEVLVELCFEPNFDQGNQNDVEVDEDKFTEALHRAIDCDETEFAFPLKDGGLGLFEITVGDEHLVGLSEDSETSISKVDVRFKGHLA